jgi:hypothetical protein
MIPVIINNRDLLTWPRAMVKKIKSFRGVGDIVIVDNGSTYPPLLRWYDTCPCHVVRIGNLGHQGPWASGVVGWLNSDYYVVTDPDMGLEATPNDTLLFLKEKIEKLGLGKIGLDLEWARVSPESVYFNHVQTYEKERRQRSKVVDGIMIDVAVDTTFAVYRNQTYFVGGGSATAPYVARHFPWELSQGEYEGNDEFKYYINHAGSSSSYKSFLRRKQAENAN